MDIKYRDLEQIFKEYFSTGYINVDINTKFALISLICYLTNALRKKKPDVTYYQVIRKLNSKGQIPDEYVKGYAIMCEDFAYGCTEFPTFNIAPKDVPKTVSDILQKWMPF